MRFHCTRFSSSCVFSGNSDEGKRSSVMRPAAAGAPVHESLLSWKNKITGAELPHNRQMVYE